ncbi:putative membrane protein [Paenibacillus sp. OAE614]
MGGWRFMNNDAVNIVSSFIGGGAALAAALLLFS